MTETRRLRPEDVDRWAHLLTPEAAGLPDPHEFNAWRGQVWAAARFGVLDAYGVGPAGAPDAVFLVQEAGGHRAVMLGLGELDTALRPGIAHLMAGAAAVSWQEATGPGWADRLADLGVRRFDHQTWLNHLPVVMERLATYPPDPAVQPWRDAWMEEAIALVVAANAGTLAGLVLALPQAPTGAGLAAEVRAMVADETKLMRDASFGYVVDGKLEGVVFLLMLDDGPALFELAVSAATRGRGAGKHLVHAAQRALHAAGHRTMHFWTTDANAPVHRISKPGESEAIAHAPSAYWIAPDLAR